MKTVKITKRRIPELIDGKLKRTGKIYFEIAYWNGCNWNYWPEEPSTIVRVNEIIKNNNLGGCYEK